MKLTELERVLQEFNISSDVYSLNGGLPNETFCLNKDNDKWEIYYSEKGNKSGRKVFDTEDEACDCFLTWIKRNLKII